MLFSASPRTRRRPAGAALASAALAAAAVTGCTPSSVGPADTGEGPAEDAKVERTTTVVPSSLNPADITAPPQKLLPAVCGTVGLSVEQVAEITGIPLSDSDPAMPGGRPEMCAYGGLWSDPPKMFELLERTDSVDPTAPGGKKPGGAATTEPSTSATDSTSTQASTARSTAPSTTPATPRSAAAEAQDTSAVFVSVAPLDGRDKDLLAGFPDELGPSYTCEMDDEKVEVPDTAKLDAPPLRWQQMTPWLLPPQPTDPNQPPPTTTRPTPTPVQNQQAGKEVEAEILRCDTDPPNTAPQVEIFFVADDAVWQIAAVVPDLESTAPSPDEQYRGLRALAGYVIGGL